MKDQSSISGYEYSHADHSHAHAYLLPTLQEELIAIHKGLGNIPPPASSTSVAEMVASERTWRNMDGPSPALIHHPRELNRRAKPSPISGLLRAQPMTIWRRSMAASQW